MSLNYGMDGKIWYTYTRKYYSAVNKNHENFRQREAHRKNHPEQRKPDQERKHDISLISGYWL